MTGLRRGELASITIGQLELDAPLPCLVLHAADEKNREGSTLPLWADLAADLARWVADKALTHREAVNDAPTVSFEAGAVESNGSLLAMLRGHRGKLVSN